MREVVQGRDTMLTIVKETVGNCMLPRLSFGLYSADLIIINSSLEVIARGQHIVRVRRHAWEFQTSVFHRFRGSTGTLRAILGEGSAQRRLVISA
jgi:hypothetical protein